MYSSHSWMPWEPVSGLEILNSLAKFWSLTMPVSVLFFSLSWPLLFCSFMADPPLAPPDNFIYWTLNYSTEASGPGSYFVNTSSLIHWQFNPHRVILFLTFPVPKRAHLSLQAQTTSPPGGWALEGHNAGLGQADVGPSSSWPVVCVPLGEWFLSQSLVY